MVNFRPPLPGVPREEADLFLLRAHRPPSNPLRRKRLYLRHIGCSHGGALAALMIYSQRYLLTLQQGTKFEVVSSLRKRNVREPTAARTTRDENPRRRELFVRPRALDTEHDRVVG